MLIVLHTGILAGPIVETNIVNADDDTIVVLLFPPQRRIMAPHGMQDRTGERNPLLPGPPPVYNASDLEFFYSLGAFGDQQSDFVGPTFNIDADVDRFFDRLRAGVDWDLYAVAKSLHYDDSRVDDMRRHQAVEYLKLNPVAGVIYVEFAYLLAPNVTQVRMIVRTAAFTNEKRFGHAREEMNVTYEYLSPIAAGAIRSWKPGEREELAAEIVDTYDEKVRKWPQNQSIYEDERDDALQEIKDSERTPTRLVLEDYWTGERLADEFRKGLEHLAPYMIADAKKFEPPRAKRREIKAFQHMSWGGYNRTLRGYVFDRADGQVVYRDRFRHLYSIPDTE